MKSKIKKNQKMVTMYVTDEEHATLCAVTDEQNKSLTEWMREAMELKLSHDSNDLNKQAGEIIDYWSKRIKELSDNEPKRPDVLDKLYEKAANYKKQKFEGQII